MLIYKLIIYFFEPLFNCRFKYDRQWVVERKEVTADEYDFYFTLMNYINDQIAVCQLHSFLLDDFLVQMFLRATSLFLRDSCPRCALFRSVIIIYIFVFYVSMCFIFDVYCVRTLCVHRFDYWKSVIE